MSPSGGALSSASGASVLTLGFDQSESTKEEMPTARKRSNSLDALVHAALFAAVAEL